MIKLTPFEDFSPFPLKGREHVTYLFYCKTDSPCQKQTLPKVTFCYDKKLTLKLAGGGVVDPPPFVFFSLKFLPLDQLPNAFAQLFLDNEDIFWH